MKNAVEKIITTFAMMLNIVTKDVAKKIAIMFATISIISIWISVTQFSEFWFFMHSIIFGFLGLLIILRSIPKFLSLVEKIIIFFVMIVLGNVFHFIFVLVFIFFAAIFAGYRG